MNDKKTYSYSVDYVRERFAKLSEGEDSVLVKCPFGLIAPDTLIHLAKLGYSVKFFTGNARESVYKVKLTHG